MGKNMTCNLVGVMEILKEVIKLPLRNKRIFLFIFLSTIIPYSFLILANAFSLIQLSNTLAMNAIPLFRMDPKNPMFLKQVLKIKRDALLLVLVEMVFLLLMTLVAIFSMVTTVYASAMSHLRRDLTINNLCSKMKKVWIRPLITWFYFSLLNAGYILLVLPVCVVLVVEKGSLVMSTVASVVILAAILLHTYLALVWIVSLVTSVLEDCCGFQALGKAETLVKGRKVVGLVLTFLLMTLVGAILVVSAISKKNQTVGIKLVIMFATLNLALLVKMLSMMVYTVFYFERKQSHGEQVNVEEDVGYSKVTTFPLLDSALP